MKVQNQKVTSRGAQRMLIAFSTSMKDELSRRSFETITVNQLCENANYPRSTFYNYFEDKYDLLDYCYSLILDSINLASLVNADESKILMSSFDRLYTLIDAHRAYVKQVLAHNSDGYLQASFHNYALKIAQKVLADAITTDRELPTELVIEHCFSTVLMVLDWVFIRQHKSTRSEAQTYLRRLYGNIV